MKMKLCAFFMAVSMLLPLCAVNTLAEPMLPTVGEHIYGYVVTDVGHSDNTGDIISLEHTKSGAKIMYVCNDDKNLAFNISYRTPMTDESDRNHVFEHAILASSDKYSSSDLFFDINNTAYNTYVNAQTNQTITSYNLASMSQPQLEKMIDAYMSCMVAPHVMQNENIFKREALRYTLASPQDDIQMDGTVFSEDMSYMTNRNNNEFNAIADSLYPGEIASNSIGMIYNDYKELTYEHAKELYDMCYHFDNCLISLWGDMDYKHILKLLDEEYLSKEERHNTDLSAYESKPTPPKFTKNVVPYPAYEGDNVEMASAVDYAIDISDMDYEDIFKLIYITSMFNSSNSIFNKRLSESDMQGTFNSMVNALDAKPYIVFSLNNTEEEYQDEFMSLVKECLNYTAQNGVGAAEYSNVLKSDDISSALDSESIDYPINSLVNASAYWSNTDETDFFEQEEKVSSGLKADPSQSILKALTAKLISPDNSALVVVEPKPGLAEEMESERKTYLADMKAAMTPKEIDALVEETNSFNEWNEKSEHNDNVVITPEELPAPEKLEPVKATQTEDIDTYSYVIDKNVGKYSLRFDASSIEQEDLLYLMLFAQLISNIDTDNYTVEEITDIAPAYINNMSCDLNYMTRASDTEPTLEFNMNWYSEQGDYEKALGIVMDVLENSDFTDTENILYTLEETMPAVKNSISDDIWDTIDCYALSGISKSINMDQALSGKNYYDFLSDIYNKIKEDSGYINTLSVKLDEISERVIHKNGLAVSVIGNEAVIDEAEKVNNEVLNSLPVLDLPKAAYSLDVPARKTAYVIEKSNQSTALVGEFDEYKGEYMPFISYINDAYTVPVMRFINGAYSAGIHSSKDIDTKGYLASYTVADPNAAKTVDAYLASADVLADKEFTQEELNKYIVSAYGNVVFPVGEYKKAERALTAEIYGGDKDLTEKLAQEIKSATPADKEEAYEAINKAIENGFIAVAGNKNAIEKDSYIFDEIVDLRVPNN